MRLSQSFAHWNRTEVELFENSEVKRIPHSGIRFCQQYFSFVLWIWRKYTTPDRRNIPNEGNSCTNVSVLKLQTFYTEANHNRAFHEGVVRLNRYSPRRKHCESQKWWRPCGFWNDTETLRIRKLKTQLFLVSQTRSYSKTVFLYFFPTLFKHYWV